MPRIIQLTILLAAVLGCLLQAAPAAAQSNRTFVSSIGNDANACTLPAPCRTLQAAFNVTNPNGEINVLDPGGYGALTITHAVSIEGHGWASLNGGNAFNELIDIQAGATDVIALHGLILEGFGTTAEGVFFETGGTLDVDDCVIRNFFDTGVHFDPAATAKLFVTNTHLTGNGTGIFTGGGSYIAAFRRVWIADSENDGIDVEVNNGATTTAGMSTANDCELSHNGIGVETFLTTLTMRNCNITGNTTGVNSTGTVRISRSTIVGNGSGFVRDGGDIQTYLDNNLHGNGTDGTAGTTLHYK